MTHLSSEELKLVRQLQAGDRDAFADFYDQFAPELFSMVDAILHDEKESAEILEQSFVRMWKRIASYDPSRSSLFTWAVMISRHEAIQRLRSRPRQARLAAAVVLETGNSQPVPIGRANMLVREDGRERVQAALPELSETEREAIDLAFFGGLTQTELLEKVGAPSATVKHRIHRGLLAFRNALGSALS